METIYVALAAISVAGLAGAVTAGVRAAAPEEGTGRRVTLSIMAFLLLCVALGGAGAIWLFWQLSTGLTF